MLIKLPEQQQQKNNTTMYVKPISQNYGAILMWKQIHIEGGIGRKLACRLIICHFRGLETTLHGFSCFLSFIFYAISCTYVTFSTLFTRLAASSQSQFQECLSQHRYLPVHILCMYLWSSLPSEEESYSFLFDTVLLVLQQLQLVTLLVILQFIVRTT